MTSAEISLPKSNKKTREKLIQIGKQSYQENKAKTIKILFESAQGLLCRYLPLDTINFHRKLI